MNYQNQKTCDHCWHAKRGAYMMVLKDGHILQECCKCQKTRQIHRDHAWEPRRAG